VNRRQALQPNAMRVARPNAMRIARFSILRSLSCGALCDECALLQALARCPTLNGKIIMGDYIPSSSVDIGCLVVIDRDEGLKHKVNLSLSELMGCNVLGLCF
jgi:hypothetical protein